MSLLRLSGDVQAFLLRATASLERVDLAVGEAYLLIRDVREIILSVRNALSEPPSKP